MDNNYIKQARISGVEYDSMVSEPQLIQDHEGIAAQFDAVQELRQKIADEKLAAIQAIDEKYREELSEAEGAYAIQFSFSR